MKKVFVLPDPEFEAEIYYFSTEEGGRSHPVCSGYRGQFYYNNQDWVACQEFIGKDLCNPGETVKVKMQTGTPEFHIRKFFLGQNFQIREGARVVGKGKITKILREDFIF